MSSVGILNLPIISLPVDNFHDRALWCQSTGINHNMHGWILSRYCATGWFWWISGLRAVTKWSSSSFTKMCSLPGQKTMRIVNNHAYGRITLLPIHLNVKFSLWVLPLSKDHTNVSININIIKHVQTKCSYTNRWIATRFYAYYWQAALCQTSNMWTSPMFITPLKNCVYLFTRESG